MGAVAARARAPFALPLALAGALLGCATTSYERDLALATAAVSAGDASLDRAADSLAARVETLPPGAPEKALLLLELGSLELRRGDLTAAAARLEVADPLLDVVDLTKDPEGELSSWLFADAARPYRAPAYEKLMVNLLGMASRAATRDWRGALVEARRFAVVMRYLRDVEGLDAGGLERLAQALSAAVHEAAGRDGEARRLSVEARGETFDPKAPPAALPAEGGQGELVVVVLSGVLPRRVAQRVPVEEAARRARSPGTAKSLRQQGVSELDLVTLAGASGATEPVVTLDGAPAALLRADVEALARATFEQAAPTLAQAALTRAMTRSAVEGGVKGAGGSRGGTVQLASFVGALMRGSDVPDTRAWTTLPAKVALLRVGLAPGAHVVTVGDEAREVAVEAGRVHVEVVVTR